MRKSNKYTNSQDARSASGSSPPAMTNTQITEMLSHYGVTVRPDVSYVTHMTYGFTTEVGPEDFALFECALLAHYSVWSGKEPGETVYRRLLAANGITPRVVAGQARVHEQAYADIARHFSGRSGRDQHGDVRSLYMALMD